MGLLGLCRGAVEFWVTAQLPAVVSYALAAVRQLGCYDILTALATDANSTTVSHVQHQPFGYTLVFIKQIIHLTVFDPAPRPTYTYFFAR